MVPVWRDFHDEGPRWDAGAFGEDQATAATRSVRHSSVRPRFLGCPAGCPLDHHTCGVDEPLPSTSRNRRARRAAWQHLHELGLLDCDGHLERFLTEEVAS